MSQTLTQKHVNILTMLERQILTRILGLVQENNRGGQA